MREVDPTAQKAHPPKALRRDAANARQKLGVRGKLCFHWEFHRKGHQVFWQYACHRHHLEHDDQIVGQKSGAVNKDQ